MPAAASASSAPTSPSTRASSPVARRVGLGLALVGSIAGHGSGDIFCAVSTGHRVARFARGRVAAELLADDEMDAVFAATVDATEEAVINAMFVADTVVGRHAHTAPGLPSTVSWSCCERLRPLRCAQLRLLRHADRLGDGHRRGVATLGGAARHRRRPAVEAHATHETAVQSGTRRCATPTSSAPRSARRRRHRRRRHRRRARRVRRPVPDWPAFPDSAAALAALHQRFRLIILSNIDQASFAASARRLGVEFDLVITAEDVGSYKPPRQRTSMPSSGRSPASASTEPSCCTSPSRCTTTTCRPRQPACRRCGSTAATGAPGPARRRKPRRSRRIGVSPRWPPSPKLLAAEAFPILAA